MRLKRTAIITAVSVVTALSSTSTMAAPLTFTELFNPVEINDPKNVVASIMNRLWKKDIQEVMGASYEFMYASFETKGNTYLVSMMGSPLCGANSCSWYVQRVSPDFKVLATSERINACQDRNMVDVTDDKLSICRQQVKLP